MEASNKAEKQVEAGLAAPPFPDNSDRWRFVSLTEDEREEVAASIDDGLLKKTQEAGVPFATSKFFDEAEVAEGVLPQSARAALSELRRGTADTVVIRGLPHDHIKGQQPGEEHASKTAPPRGNALLSTVVRRLGFEYSYAKEKDGALVHDIFPTKAGATKQSNESWKVDLSLHTENAFHPIRPDFVVLYCVRTPEAPPATHLAVLRDILPRLTDEEVATLKEPRFTIKVVDSFLTGGEENARLQLKILDGCSRHPVVRWHENVRGIDKSAENAVQAFSAAAKAAAQAVRLQPGDLLAFANETCLHGRDKFDASLDGSDRWLLRSYVRRDLTPLMPFVLSSAPQTIRMDLNARAVG